MTRTRLLTTVAASLVAALTVAGTEPSSAKAQSAPATANPAYFTQPLKERIIAEPGYGLQLEGASASALVAAFKVGAK